MQQSTTTADAMRVAVDQTDNLSRSPAWWAVTTLQGAVCAGWAACFWWVLS